MLKIAETFWYKIIYIKCKIHISKQIGFLAFFFKAYHAYHSQCI